MTGQFEVADVFKNEGRIFRLADGIVWIDGLNNAQYGEQLEFIGNLFGIVISLERDFVVAMVLGSMETLTEGQKVLCTGKILHVPVGEALLGRVVDAFGHPIDGRGAIDTLIASPIEKVGPGIIWREQISQPLQTGIKAVDYLVPLGRGQTEIIFGDRQTGKTTLALDAIIHQKDSGVKCIYVAIGQNTSSVSAIVRKLEEHDAMKHTIVVVATADESAALQFIAPFSGSSMGEYFRDKGEDALIVYDDLTKHASAYRQILLCSHGHSSAREENPTNLRYLYSRLLERAGRVNEGYVQKKTVGKVKGLTGSLSALPIIEILDGNGSDLVPANFSSIADGQIYLDRDLVDAGIFPALNSEISLSLVGGAAQTKIIKKLAGSLRITLSQYRDLAAFSSYSQELDQGTINQLEKGTRAVEMLKQKPYAALTVAEMAISLFALDKGYLDNIPVAKIVDFEKALHQFARAQHNDLLQKIDLKGELNPEIELAIKSLIEQFKAGSDEWKVE